MATVVLFVGIVIAVAVYVAWPYLERRLAAKSFRDDSEMRARLTNRLDDVLAAIKDIELDRETGKVTEADHADMTARYRGEAVGILRKLDVLKDERTANRADDIEERIRARREQRNGENGGLNGR